MRRFEDGAQRIPRAVQPRRPPAAPLQQLQQLRDRATKGSGEQPVAVQPGERRDGQWCGQIGSGLADAQGDRGFLDAKADGGSGSSKGEALAGGAQGPAQTEQQICRELQLPAGPLQACQQLQLLARELWCGVGGLHQHQGAIEHRQRPVGQVPPEPPQPVQSVEGRSIDRHRRCGAGRWPFGSHGAGLALVAAAQPIATHKGRSKGRFESLQGQAAAGDQEGGALQQFARGKRQRLSAREHFPGCGVFDGGQGSAGGEAPGVPKGIAAAWRGEHRRLGFRHPEGVEMQALIRGVGRWQEWAEHHGIQAHRRQQGSQIKMFAGEREQPGIDNIGILQVLIGQRHLRGGFQARIRFLGCAPIAHANESPAGGRSRCA